MGKVSNSSTPWVGDNNNEVSSKAEEKIRVIEGIDGTLYENPEHNPSFALVCNSVRDRFLSEYESNPDLYLESDLPLIKDDYFIRRFVYPNQFDEDGTFRDFRAWMQFRREIGFENLKDSRFPIEFYQIGALFPYTRDVDGTQLLFMRFKVYRSIPQLDEALKQFIMHNIDKVDRGEKKERSWAIVFDTQGAGITNVNFDMFIFLLRNIKAYYPFGMKYVCVYDLPWILTGAWGIAKKLIPEDAAKLFRFFNKSNIRELISEENLPDFMGGTCPIDYCAIPDGCKSAEEVAEESHGMTLDDVKAIKKHFDKYLPNKQVIIQ